MKFGMSPLGTNAKSRMSALMTAIWGEADIRLGRRSFAVDARETYPRSVTHFAFSPREHRYSLAF